MFGHKGGIDFHNSIVKRHSLKNAETVLGFLRNSIAPCTHYEDNVAGTLKPFCLFSRHRSHRNSGLIYVSFNVGIDD